MSLSRNRHFGFDRSFAVELANREIICTKGFFEAHQHGHKILTDGASKEVNGTVIILRPGVQAGMRFGKQQETGKTMRAKFIKSFINDGQTEKGFFVIRITGDRLRAAMRIRSRVSPDQKESAPEWEWKWLLDKPLAPFRA